MFEEKLQVQMSLLEELQAQAAILGEDLHILQPVVAKAKVEAEAAKAKAEVAKARAIAEGMADDVIGKLRCYKCMNKAEAFFKNDLEPQRNDSCCIHGFSGTCFTHIRYGNSHWGGSWPTEQN